MKDTVFKDLQQVHDELQQQTKHPPTNTITEEDDAIISHLTEEQIFSLLQRDGRSFALEA